MNEPIHTAECFANHMGAYAAWPVWMRAKVAAIKAGTEQSQPTAARDAERPYQMSTSGIAVIPIIGPMMKGASKFQHANTLWIRHALRAARRDPDVLGIMLHIDSPGGMVSGTEELVGDVRAAAKEMPVHAHLDDLGASAAYWVASQAHQVTANAGAIVGSIGTYTVLYDYSKAAELEGIEVHVISSGGLKGAGEPGTELSEEYLAEVQTLIDDLNELFVKGVAAGRADLTLAKVRQLADGRVYVGAKARAAGLVDQITSADGAHQELSKAIRSRQKEARTSKVRGGLAQKIYNLDP